MRGVVVATMAVAIATAVQAQQAAPGRTITYEEAVAIALKQNPAVLQAQNATDLSDANVAQQKMQFLPDLRLSASTANAVGRTFSQSDGALLNQSTQSLNLGLSSSVTLFDGFRNVANLKQAQLNQDATESELDRARQTAVFTVAAQFLALVQGEEQLKVQREALAAQQAEEEQIQAMVRVGSRPVADLYQQQASVASTRAAVVAAQRAWDEAKLDLVQTLQLDPAAEYEFATPAIATSDEAAFYDVSVLIAAALAKRPELAAQTARQSAAEQAVRAATGARLPTVSLGANYNTGASSASDLALADQLDQRRGGSLSLSVSVPLFDRNSAKTAAQEAARNEVALQKTMIDYYTGTLNPAFPGEIILGAMRVRVRVRRRVRD